MSVLAFNHFNIRAPKPVLEQVKYFYLEVIGLTEGFRPDVPILGYWLYLEDLPVLHLMEWRDIAKAPKYEKGYLDHVAFSCDDLENFIIKLKNLEVAYTRRDFNLSGDVFTQLEVTDPVGNGVELNFSQ
jgi:catechol-2,3-dioxygenase